MEIQPGPSRLRLGYRILDFTPPTKRETNGIVTSGFIVGGGDFFVGTGWRRRTWDRETGRQEAEKQDAGQCL